MSQKTSKLLFAIVLVVGAFGAIAIRVAWATPPKGLAQTLIAGPVSLDNFQVVHQTPSWGVIMQTRGNSDAYVATNTIAPGGDTGWHSHPGPVFVLITAGAATVYEGDDPTFTPTVYPAGTGFIDEPDTTHIVRNEGDVNLVLTAVFLVPQGAPRRIDEPAPAGAPF
jgi:quercetin dioxygenase-like cupin family protein